jgi:hypothetical protein
MMLARLTSIPVPYVVSAAAIVAALVLAVAHERPPAPPHVAPPAMSVQLEQLPVAPKGDDELPDWPHVVRTIPIVQAASPVVAAPVITAPEVPAPLARVTERPKPRNASDVCARHGGHRVDDGRKWHCVYPKRGKP